MNQQRKVHIAPPAERRAASSDDDPQMVEVNSSRGKSFFERGEMDNAYEAFTEAHRIAVAINAPDASIAQLLNNLTLCAQQMGKWQEALDLCERCLRVRRNFQQESHAEYLRCCNHLANCYYHRKKYTKAKKIYDDVLLISTQKLGETHIDTMRAMHNAGLMAFHAGKKSEAEKVLTSCLNLRQNILGRNHPDTMSSQKALNGMKESGGCTIM